MYRFTSLILFCVSACVLAQSLIDFNLSTQKAIKIEAPYEMSKTIDLNKGVCFVIPDGEKYLRAANELKDFLSDRGIKDITFSNDKDFAKQQNNIIAIGDINSNFMIERLYWNWYTPMVPGVLINSYAIQTIFSPIGVYPQGDVIVLGVSNVDALPQLVEDFKAFTEDNAEDNKLTPYYRLYGKAVAQFRESFFEQFKNAGGLYGFTMLLDHYWRNMDERYFDTALEVLLERAEENKQDPAMLKVDWNDELNCYKTIQYWDMFSRFYALTDEQRLDIDRLFISSIDVLLNRCSGYHEIKEDYIITWNHTNIPLLAIYTISRYLTNRYGIEHPILDEFYEKTKICFEDTVDNYRPMEESIGYTLLTAEYNMYYYLMENKLDFVDNGGARKLTDLVMFNTDNNGHFAGQGDVAQVYGFPGHNRGFSLLYYLTQDGLFKYMAERVNSFRFKVNTLFDAGIEPVKPERYVGVQYLPIDKGMYELMFNYTFEYEPISPPAFPREMTFDKLQFRSSAEPDADYLLVDGLGRGKHQHYDTNAIISYTAMGYKFLFDSDYLTKKTSDHSIINVCKNGRSEELIGSVAALTDIAEFEDSAFTSSLVAGYKGVDWVRNIYWEKERYFAVIDTVRVQETADYVIDCTWKVLDRGMEAYDGKTLVCKAPVAHDNVMGSGEKLDPTREFPEQTFKLKSTSAGGWWDHRTSARGVSSHRIHQTLRADMQRGDYLSFQNIFYVKRQTDGEDLSSFTPQKINSGAMVIDAHDGWNLLLVDDASFGDIVSRGKFISVSDKHITAVNAKSLRKNGESLFVASNPVNIYAKGGNLRIEAKVRGTLRIHGFEQEFEYDRGVAEYQGVILSLPLDRKSIPIDNGGDAALSDEIPLNEPQFDVEWQSQPTGFEYDSATDMAVADLNKDGSMNILITTKTGYAFVYDIEGNKIWEYFDESGLYSVAVGDLNGDGKNHVFLGTGTHSVLTLDIDGNLVSTLDVPVESSGRYGTRTYDPQHITVIKVFDINQDGNMELIIGTRTWQAQIFDSNYQQQWFFTYNYHGVLEIEFADMDNNGIIDIITADRYGSVRVLDWNDDDFATSIKTYTTVGDVSLGTTDFDGDGIREIVNASDSGNLALFTRPQTLQLKIKDSWDPYYRYIERWSFNNFGYSYYDIEILTDRNGGESIIAASETGYVYSLKPATGELNWQRYLGSIVRTLTVDADKYVLAGTEKGDLFLLEGADGRLLRTARLSGRIHKILRVTSATYAVSDTYGNVALISF